MKRKKSLGQNFFINKNLSKQIVELVLKENPDIIVEIGPGTGSFTKELYQSKARLILIEKDNELYQNLQYAFPQSQIENYDFLEWNLDNLKKYTDKKILFFGSLPYNISKLIIKKIVESEHFKNPAFFIIQKEVADKYIAENPNSNLLSLKTKIYADTERIFNISPDSFRPKPKVDSSFIMFSPKEKIEDIDVVQLKKFLQICFKQPRKTLKNNLKGAYPNLSKNNIKGSFEKLLTKRPQHLSLEEFLFLYNNL
ncbi:MAG: 16S rRNA (adenine(1518)-N(6)/adenine(1519)-N(6))-dimethyltransferase RsmA [Candidatus Dojkabacteria bacterium]